MESEKKKSTASENISAKSDVPSISVEVKNSTPDRKLTPIGSSNDDIPFAQWVIETSSAIRREGRLAQLESILKDGKYTAKEKHHRPIPTHGPKPREPITTNDSIMDARNMSTYLDAMEEWEEKNVIHLADTNMFDKRNVRWQLNEDDNIAKFPQLYQFIADRLSPASKDLIATRKMNWEKLDNNQDPIQLMKFISETHSALSSGVLVLDQLNTGLLLWEVKMKDTESIRAY
jgi:hypothetical protein